MQITKQEVPVPVGVGRGQRGHFGFVAVGAGRGLLSMAKSLYQNIKETLPKWISNLCDLLQILVH